MNVLKRPRIIVRGDFVVWTEEAKRILKIQTLFLGEGPFLVLDAQINTPLVQIDILIDVDRPHALRYDWFSYVWFRRLPRESEEQTWLEFE